MSDVAIRINHVSKVFGEKVAVNDVSFEVQQGQCYGLIGPNGAGKTTTFSMMCGFLFPSGGEISVLGANPSDPGALKKLVGVLPQDAVLPAAWPVGALLTHESGWTLEVIAGNEKHVIRLRLHPPSPQEDPED